MVNQYENLDRTARCLRIWFGLSKTEDSVDYNLEKINKVVTRVGWFE